MYNFIIKDHITYGSEVKYPMIWFIVKRNCQLNSLFNLLYLNSIGLLCMYSLSMDICKEVWSRLYRKGVNSLVTIFK